MLENLKRLAKVARRPTRSELMLLFKVNLIGIAIIGIITYLIRVVAMVLLGGM
jgi:protein translocase SEC61 complex gamma subunit